MVILCLPQHQIIHHHHVGVLKPNARLLLWLFFSSSFGVPHPVASRTTRRKKYCFVFSEILRSRYVHVHVTFTFTLRLSSHYQVYFHFLHHHQPLNHLRMEVNEFSNLSLFTLNVNSTMLRWRKPREWKKQPCTSRRLWQSTSLLSRLFGIVNSVFFAM